MVNLETAFQMVSLGTLLLTGLVHCVPSINGPTQINIMEGIEPGTIIGRLSVTGGDAVIDPDDSNTASLVMVKPTQTLSTYNIALSRTLDREVQAQYLLKFRAVDKDGHVVARSSITLVVNDINDNAPLFTKQHYDVTVQENKQNAILITVQAFDYDWGQNGMVQYSLMKKTPASGNYVSIDSDTGVIRLTQSLDYETTPLLEYNVLAKDMGTPQLTSTAELTIHVQDAQDPPVFIRSLYSASVRENSPISLFVLQVSAVDGDSGTPNKVIYNISRDDCGEVFRINTTTGELFTKTILDRESAPVIHNSGLCSLTVTAHEVHTDDISIIAVNGTSETDVKIQIVGVDEFVPTFTAPSYEARLEEDAPVNTILGLLHTDGIRVVDSDEGEGGSVTLSLQYPNGSSVTGLNILTTGTEGSRVSQLVLTDTAFLDALKQGSGSTSIKIIAESSPFQRSSVIVRITVFQKSNKQPCSQAATSPSSTSTPSSTQDPSTICQHGGLHLDTDGSARCYCAPGYVGQYCELDLDECMYNPCENNGTCVNTQGSYKCACMDGQMGPHCSLSDCHDTAGFPCWIMGVFKLCDDVRIAAECGKSCNRCPQNNGQQASVFVG